MVLSLLTYCANHTQHLTQHALTRRSGGKPRKILKIFAPEIESGSSFDRELCSYKTHGGWLATPSTPLDQSLGAYATLCN